MKQNLALVPSNKSKIKPVIHRRKKNAEELSALSTIEFYNCVSNQDRLVKIRSMLEGLFPIAEGLYKDSPSQSTTYALTNLIDRYQNLADQINELDADNIAYDIIEIVIKPFIEQITLDLGGIIEREVKGSTVSSKVKKVLNNVFIDYARNIEKKIPGLESDITKVLK